MPYTLFAETEAPPPFLNAQTTWLGNSLHIELTYKYQWNCFVIAMTLNVANILDSMNTKYFECRICMKFRLCKIGWKKVSWLAGRKWTVSYKQHYVSCETILREYSYSYSYSYSRERNLNHHKPLIANLYNRPLERRRLLRCWPDDLFEWPLELPQWMEPYSRHMLDSPQHLLNTL